MLAKELATDGYIEGRNIYISTDLKFCIWLKKEARKWWLGNCQDAGKNAGLAFLDYQESCPISYIFTLKDGLTNQPLLTNGLSILIKY